MSLKNIIKKAMASLGAILLVFSNCSMCGIGLIKVIAENVTAPEIVTEIENVQYVQYNEEEYTGVAIQSQLTVYPNQEENSYIPTDSVEVKVNLTSLNGYLPEKATVVEARTKSTTGEELNMNINQNYDSNSGLLTIAYENQNMYSEYNENAKDEFEIIYTYPAEAYTGNENELKLSYVVNVKMKFRTENGSVTSQSSEILEVVENENKGDLNTFGVTELKNKIYKGFLYSNVQNKTSYDTEYKTVSTFAVLNSSVLDEVEVELKESKFVLNDTEKTEISANGNIAYKSTTISKCEFDRMLGEGGHIDFYHGDIFLATVKYMDVENIKKLAVIYSEEDIRILNDNTTFVVVEYGDNITSLRIKISEPITEGFIHFENESIIKASEDYGVKVEDLKYTSVESVVNENQNITELELFEPETKIEVNSSNMNFSTLQSNRTTLTIKLDDTNASTKLFDNPEIIIKLPDGLINGSLSSPEIVNGNGLEIKEAKTEDNCIKIKLQGKQTSYDLTNVSGGVSIVMDIENIDYADTLSTHTDKIEVTCTQSEEQTTASQSVNIVSKAGLLMLSTITGYDSENNVIKTMDSNVQNIEIENDSKAKEAVQTLTLVNNYNEDLNDVQIVGRIGYSNNELHSTFDINLTKAITTNNENAKVYYSINEEAEYNDDSWTEEFTSEAKAYKVVLESNTLAKGNNIVITNYLQIPKNIEYCQETYINTVVDYIVGEVSQSDSATICLATKFANIKSRQTSGKISAELSTREDSYIYNEGVDVTYNLNSIVEYCIKVKNNSEEKVKDIKVEYEIPQYLTYEEGGIGKYDEFEGYLIEQQGECNNNIFEYNISQLKPIEEKVIVIRCKVQPLNNRYYEEVASIANVYFGEEIYSTNIKTIKLSQAAYEISLVTDAQELLEKDDIINYTIQVKNIGDRSGSFKIKDNIPEEIEVTNMEYYIDENNKTTIGTSKQNIELSYNIDKDETLTLIITGKIKEIETEDGAERDIENIVELDVSGREIVSKTVNIKVQTVKIEEDIGNEDLPEYKEDDKTNDVEIPEDTYKPLDPSTQVIPDGDVPNDSNQNQPQEPEKPEDKNDSEESDGQDIPGEKEESKYTISGKAWLDSNKNGQKENEEKLMDSVVVTLLDNKTGKILIDDLGKETKRTTGSNGEYKFENLREGNYLVVFEFDTSKYTVTTYQKSGIEDSLNSDVIKTNVRINNESKLVGITNNIILNSNKESIDIGLIENPIFDLSLDKQITKITVNNSQGTEFTEYDEGDTAKIDLVAKYMSTATVIVNYKFTVTNEGDITGYVNTLVDDLPSGLEFSSELNKDWYKGSDGRLYSTALSNIGIKPGESKDIELVLTKKMTEDNTGVFPNNAELKEISNLENIKEKEDAKDNNRSSATLIISIKTGSIILYTGVTISCIAIILAGAYMIKKKVLNRVI